MYFTLMELHGTTGSFAQGSKEELAYYMAVYDSSTGHHFRYSGSGDRFGDNVGAVGFIQDDDRREMDGDCRRSV
jgi:hypothetical protein